MRRFLFGAMTVGERPEVALHHRQDWFAHTDEFRRDYSAPAYVFELLRGALCHVSWRITRKSDVSLLPISFMLALQAVFMMLVIVSKYGSIDFNEYVNFVAVVLYLLWIWSAIRRPWDLSFRWSFSTLLLIIGATQILTALTVRPLTALNVGSFLVGGLGSVLIAASSVRQKLILGSSLTAVTVAVTGALLGVSRIAWNTRGEGLSTVIEASGFSAIFTFALYYCMWRVWFAGQNSATEAVGDSSGRPRPGLHMYAP